MKDMKIAKPVVTKEPDEFVIRKALRDSRLEKLPIENLFPAPQYPLGEHEEYLLTDLTENIRLNGVLIPILVREKDGGYEIIDGAARYEAAKALGETEIDAKIITCSDEAAIMIAYECNICRRSIRDLKPSAQAKIISEYYYSLKNQGRRSDLIYRAAHGEDRMFYDLRDEYEIARGIKPERSYSFADQKYKKYDVKKSAAARYGLSGRNIARYLRINQLAEPLKALLDAGKLGFSAAAELSYLSETQQLHVAEAAADGAFVNIKNAYRLKEMALKTRRRNPEVFLNRERIRRTLATPEPEKERQEEEDYKASALAAAKAAGAKIPGGDVPNYKPIENLDNYLKENYPRYFSAQSLNAATDDDKFVMSLIKFFVAIKDKMCYYFPGKYRPETSAAEILKKIYQATLLYFAAVVSGKITPPAEAEM